MDPNVYALLVYFVVPVIVLLLIYFWVRQFVELMLLTDDSFPGRHDKVLWCVALLTFCVIAAAAFVLWKRAYLVVRREGRAEK